MKILDISATPFSTKFRFPYTDYFITNNSANLSLFRPLQSFSVTSPQPPDPERRLLRRFQAKYLQCNWNSPFNIICEHKVVLSKVISGEIQHPTSGDHDCQITTEPYKRFASSHKASSSSTFKQLITKVVKNNSFSERSGTSDNTTNRPYPNTPLQALYPIDDLCSLHHTCYSNTIQSYYNALQPPLTLFTVPR